MKTYNVGIVLSTTYTVQAENEEEAEELAKDLAEEEYIDLIIEEANFVELIEDDEEEEENNENN